MSSTLSDVDVKKVFSISLPFDVTEFTLVLHARDVYRVNRGLLVCLEMLDKDGESIDSTSAFCSFSEAVGSWFTYYPENADTEVVRLRSISVAKHVSKIRLWLENWNDKETEVSDYLHQVFVIAKMTDNAKYMVTVCGEVEES